MGSNLFALSFMFTGLYLVKDRAERRAATAYAGSTVGAAYIGAATTEEGALSDLVAAEDAPAREGRSTGATFTCYAVNPWIAGLHPYAGVK